MGFGGSTGRPTVARHRCCVSRSASRCSTSIPAPARSHGSRCSVPNHTSAGGAHEQRPAEPRRHPVVGHRCASADLPAWRPPRSLRSRAAHSRGAALPLAGRLSDGFDALGRNCRNLRALRLDVGTHLDDVSFLRHAEQLQVLVLEETTLGARAFDALVDLPKTCASSPRSTPRWRPSTAWRPRAPRSSSPVAARRSSSPGWGASRCSTLPRTASRSSPISRRARRRHELRRRGVVREGDAARAPRRNRVRQRGSNFCANARRAPLEELVRIIERLVAERSAMPPMIQIEDARRCSSTLTGSHRPAARGGSAACGDGSRRWRPLPRRALFAIRHPPVILDTLR